MERLEAHRPAPLLALAAAVVAWASAFPAIRVALHGLDPIQVALLRLVVASMLMAVLVPLAKPRLPRAQDLPLILLMGLSGMAAYQVMLNVGEIRVAAGTASILVNASRIFTALMAVAFLGERISALAWVGIWVAFAGVTVVGLSQGASLRIEAGSVLVLAAGLSQAVFFILQKPLLDRYTSYEVTAYASWAGTLMLAIAAPSLPGTLAAGLAPLLAVLWLGVVSSGLGFLCWTFALSRLPVSIGSSGLYGVPPVAFLIGWLLLGEVPARLTLVGGVIALAGIVMIGLRRSPRTGPPATSKETIEPCA